MTEKRPRILLCDPEHYRVAYVINPWMEGQVGRLDFALAQTQWAALRRALGEVADVEVMPAVPNLPDLVFASGAGFVLDGKAVLSRFYHAERRPEEAAYERWFRANGFEVVAVPEPLRFEGAGDARFDAAREIVWCGYGLRTSLESHRTVAEALRVEVVSLRLIDPRFYHLDTCFTTLSGGEVLLYPPALDRPSLRVIEERVPPAQRIAVSEADAMALACNAVEIGGTLLMHSASEALKADLAARGYRVADIDLSEFHRAGASAHGLILRLDGRRTRPAAAVSAITGRELELQGHLLNTGLMARVLDIVTDNGGSFDILAFHAGQRPEDVSHARLRVTAPRPQQLDAIVEQIHARGAQEAEQEHRDARLVAAAKDGVAPPDFHVTTIYPAEVRVGGVWVPVENRRMDAAIVVTRDAGRPRARCALMRDLRVGDLIVCGFDGVRVQTPQAGGGRREEFAFMSAGVSSERRVEVAVEQIAWEMRRIRDRGGKVVVVAGPVVIHTGGGPYLAALIREGHVQALLGGNAIAAHDMEQSVFGTSLGVDLRSSTVVEGGHRHHLRVINAVRDAGGIRQAVESGFIKSGVMFECIRRGVPFALAGSIRDDGPLPETRMDLIQAQREYSELLRGADMVLLLSSMLHAIGVGNMTPSGVKLICVDISPAVVTKLADRGSLESVGIVTDVGLFLTELTQKLNVPVTANATHASA